MQNVPIQIVRIFNNSSDIFLQERQQKNSFSKSTCRSCCKSFKTLVNHLVKKSECRAAYTEEEIKATKRLKKSARNKRYKDKLDSNSDKSTGSTCRHCKKNFIVLRNHLAKKTECKGKYSKSELQAMTKLSTSAKKKKYRDANWDEKIRDYQSQYYQANKEELARKRKNYMQKNQDKIIRTRKRYYIENQKRIVENQRKYDRKNKSEISLKRKTYYKENKKSIFQHKKMYNEIKDMEWDEGSLKGLLQEKPMYKSCWYRKAVKWVDQEQLVDYLRYFKESGDPEYQDVDIDYSYMPISCEHNPQPTNPKYPEVGLMNLLVYPGRITWRKKAPIRTLDGEVLKKNMNIIVKLRTTPSQPEVNTEAGVPWWIEEDQLIKTVKFWKTKGHSSLRGIRFPDIPDDWESQCGWTESQREKNKEKVIKSWKYLATKPHKLLKKYHSYESSDDSDDEDWHVTAGEELLKDVPQYKEFCGGKMRRDVKWIDPEQLVDCLRHFKDEGIHEYQDFEFDYWLMPTEEINPEAEQETGPNSQSIPKYCEVGLCNALIFPGDYLPGTYDGEEVTEDINVILKLKTMSNQPEVEIDAGVYWWIEPDHLIQAVRYWRERDHPCLKAITFTDTKDKIGWNWLWNSQERKKKEENVIRNWKHLSSKPYNLLTKYHQKFLDENNITCEEDLELKFLAQSQLQLF